MRPYAGDADLPLITDLIRSAPPASRHLVEFPWRLSSPALQGPSDARLWATSDGLLASFVARQVWCHFGGLLPRSWELTCIHASVGVIQQTGSRYRCMCLSRGSRLPTKRTVMRRREAERGFEQT